MSECETYAVVQHATSPSAALTTAREPSCSPPKLEPYTEIQVPPWEFVEVGTNLVISGASYFHSLFALMGTSNTEISTSAKPTPGGERNTIRVLYMIRSLTIG